MTAYDFSVFAGPLPNEKPVHLPSVSSNAITEPGDVACILPPPVKESKIHAWQSAERTSAAVIFDNAAVSGGPDDSMVVDDDSVDDSTIETSAIHQSRDAWKNSDSDSFSVIRSLPGATRSEFATLAAAFAAIQRSHSPEDASVEAPPPSAASFVNTHTLAGKRKAQVARKREMLHKLFGYLNSVNLDFITNNTSHLALDNTMNAQKAFLEDREEMAVMAEEAAAFEQGLEELRHLRSHVNGHVNGHMTGHVRGAQVMDHVHSQVPVDSMALWLDEDPDVLAEAIAALRQRVHG